MRIRNIDHVDGNWATLVYINLDNLYLTEFIEDCMESLKDQSVNLIKDRHISLSRTLYLKSHQINSFLASLERKLQFDNFQISFSDFQIYQNDERTCNFVGLNVLSGKSQILKLVNAVNAVTKSLGLPTYYDDPSFHTSFAWSLQNIDLNELMMKSDSIHSIVADVSSVHVKCGNRIYEYNL